MPYIHFTDEQKRQANLVDLSEFLRRKGEPLIASGRELRMGSNHSVTIRGNEWYDHAAETGGGPVSFLKEFYGMDYQQAVLALLGQDGTARWATVKEIAKTFSRVPFKPSEWRQGKNLPKAQGLVLGSQGKKGKIVALVDSDDIHCLMIGASGVGKTAFFLYPNLEYACASGMSFLALDTKGDLARNYGTVAQKYYGYEVSVIDLRNPTRSDGLTS